MTIGVGKYFTFIIRKYPSSKYGFRKLWPGKYALDFGKTAWIFEFWFVK